MNDASMRCCTAGRCRFGDIPRKKENVRGEKNWKIEIATTMGKSLNPRFGKYHSKESSAEWVTGKERRNFEGDTRLKSEDNAGAY